MISSTTSQIILPPPGMTMISSCGLNNNNDFGEQNVQFTEGNNKNINNNSQRHFQNNMDITQSSGQQGFLNYFFIKFEKQMFLLNNLTEKSDH
jgi:hypothetical protein